MRLAALGMSHETNTFSRVPADYEQFANGGIARGDKVVREYRDSNATMAGFLVSTSALTRWQAG